MFDRTVENLRDAVHFIDDVVVDEKLFSVEKYNVIVRTPSRFRCERRAGDCNQNKKRDDGMVVFVCHSHGVNVT